MAAEVSEQTIDDLARAAAVQALKTWAGTVDPADLCDQLYEVADQAGRQDICTYLEYDYKGYAGEMKDALSALISEVEGQAKQGTRHARP